MEPKVLKCSHPGFAYKKISEALNRCPLSFGHAVCVFLWNMIVKISKRDQRYVHKLFIERDQWLWHLTMVLPLPVIKWFTDRMCWLHNVWVCLYHTLEILFRCTVRVSDFPPRRFIAASPPWLLAAYLCSAVSRHQSPYRPKGYRASAYNNWQTIHKKLRETCLIQSIHTSCRLLKVHFYVYFCVLMNITLGK